MRRNDEVAVKALVKVNQEYSYLKNRPADNFRLLKGNYFLTRIRQELSDYFTDDQELEKLLDKVDKRFKESEFSEDLNGQTDENRYQLEQHRDIRLKFMEHRTATEKD